MISTKLNYEIMKNNKITKILIFLLSLGFYSSINTQESQLSIEELRELESQKQEQSIIKDEEKFLEIQTTVKRDPEEDDCLDCIYGYELFDETPTTFALSTNVPVPQEYVMAPGDKIKIEYFGSNSDKSELYISRSGELNLPLLGPINISGLDFNYAKKLIENKVKNELIGTDVFISLAEMRSINVYAVGAAYKPGTYTLGALSSLTSVIFSTGGPSREGSLRNIQLKRDGKIIQTYDFYDLLLKGDTSSDVRLLDGDTIYYPLIESSARVDGAVMRAGLFEVLPGDTIETLIDFSGLRNRNLVKLEYSYFDELTESRKADSLKVDAETLQKKVFNGDSINVINSSQLEFSNVLLKGEFVYPGYYDISSNLTILDVIEKAGGFTDSAYPEASVFTRESIKDQQKESYIKTAENLEKSLIDAVSTGNQIEGEAYEAIVAFINNLKETEPAGRQVVSVDEYSLKTDPRLNFQLQDGDVLYIPKRSSSVAVVGEVLNSTTHLFSNDLTVMDYIELSGGLTDGADPSKIFVIFPSGQAVTFQRKLFQSDLSQRLIPGSTIVVSRNPDPFNWLKLASVISPVLSDLAVSAAAIAAISDNNN